MKLSRILSGRHRFFGVMAICASGVALAAPAADASTTSSASGCTPGAVSQAFSQWGDTNEYELAPGGNFASASSGWTLTGGARIVSVAVPFDLGGVGDVGALYLPPGSTAQSPFMCVDSTDPTYRFTALGVSGLNLVNAQAVYQAPITGLPLPVTTGAVQAPTSWGPVPTQVTGAAPVSALSGGTSKMALRFTSLGATMLDDVFVDPLMRHG